jgi:predicted ester cyclase
MSLRSSLRRIAQAGIMRGVDPLEERMLPRRRSSSCVVAGREEQGTSPPLLGGFRQRRLGHTRRADGPHFVDRSLLPGQGSSREEYKRSATEFHAAFSNTGFTIEDQIAEGDKVVTKFSLMSIHRSEFLGVPPSGEVRVYSSIRIRRTGRGKITGG